MGLLGIKRYMSCVKLINNFGKGERGKKSRSYLTNIPNREKVKLEESQSQGHLLFGTHRNK